MAKRQAHVAPVKKEQVQRLDQLIKDHKIIAIAKVAGIPGPQLQKIRRMLRGKAEIVVSKNSLFQLALADMEKGKPGLKGLGSTIHSQTALVATNLNPFLLFKQMEATKMPSPAKGGEIAPDDISVSEGETSFKPGPIVGELQKAGIPAGIEGGKVFIKKDKMLVKKGDRIPRELAPMLTKLEIFPLVVGLDLQAAWESGTVYPANLLAIDEVKIMGDMGKAAAHALHHPAAHHEGQEGGRGAGPGGRHTDKGHHRHAHREGPRPGEGAFRDGQDLTINRGCETVETVDKTQGG
jgi:large subunit ribosomal protein L10